MEDGDGSFCVFRFGANLGWMELIYVDTRKAWFFFFKKNVFFFVIFLVRPFLLTSWKTAKCDFCSSSGFVSLNLQVLLGFFFVCHFF